MPVAMRPAAAGEIKMPQLPAFVNGLFARDIRLDAT